MPDCKTLRLLGTFQKETSTTRRDGHSHGKKPGPYVPQFQIGRPCTLYSGNHRSTISGEVAKIARGSYACIFFFCFMDNDGVLHVNGTIDGNGLNESLFFTCRKRRPYSIPLSYSPSATRPARNNVPFLLWLTPSSVARIGACTEK
jgi:hypothetical protein